LIERAQALLAAGRAAEAIALLEPEARAQPGRFELWDCLGRAYGMAGRHSQAEAAFREAARLRPDLYAAHFNLGLSLAYQDRLRESVAHFVRARAIDPRNAELRSTLFPILVTLLQQPAGGGPDRRFAPLPAEPLVSVITPTKNRARMLADAIASVRKQTYRNWELIVVNDGGAGVGALVESAAGNARYIERRESGGPAAARNAGVAAARGEVLAFLDDDNLYLPGHLESLLAALRGSAALAYSSAERVLERVDGTRRVELKREPLVPDLRPARELLLVRNFIDMSTVAARRECFAEFGAFDEDPEVLGLEDWELLLRFSAHVRLHPVKKATLEYRVTTLEGDSVTKQHGRRHRERVRAVYRRHQAPGLELVGLARELYLETL
jgi:GT2 family glycosyltransferase